MDGSFDGTVPATVHGHYWVRPAARPQQDGAPLLVGFHGYGEDGESFLGSLAAVPGSEGWHIASVQALHPFYRRDGRVVASWMTRFDRELAIEDNITYARSAVEAIRSGLRAAPALVFAGFSQGVAMAYRAAAALPASGLLALAGDVPPEVDPARLPPVLVGRGCADEWYDDGKLQADLERLRAAGVRATPCVFDGGHEWTREFYRAAGTFLAEIQAGS